MNRMPSKPHRAEKNTSSSGGGEAPRRQSVSDVLKGSNEQIVARLKLALSDRGKGAPRQKSSGVGQNKKSA